MKRRFEEDIAEEKVSHDSQDEFLGIEVLEDSVEPPSKKPRTDLGIPKSFFCPITGLIMVEPVLADDEQTYEKVALEKWLAEHKTSPITRAVISHPPVLNRALRDQIRQFLENNEKNADIQAQVFDRDVYRLEEIKRDYSNKKDKTAFQKMRGITDKQKLVKFCEDNKIFVFGLFSALGSIEDIQKLFALATRTPNSHDLDSAIRHNKSEVVEYFIAVLGERAKACIQVISSQSGILRVLRNNENYNDVFKVLCKYFGDIIAAEARQLILPPPAAAPAPLPRPVFPALPALPLPGWSMPPLPQVFFFQRQDSMTPLRKIISENPPPRDVNSNKYAKDMKSWLKGIVDKLVSDGITSLNEGMKGLIGCEISRAIQPAYPDELAKQRAQLFNTLSSHFVSCFDESIKSREQELTRPGPGAGSKD